MNFNIIIDWIMNRADASPFVVGKDLSVQDLDYIDDWLTSSKLVERS